MLKKGKNNMNSKDLSGFIESIKIIIELCDDKNSMIRYLDRIQKELKSK